MTDPRWLVTVDECGTRTSITPDRVRVPRGRRSTGACRYLELKPGSVLAYPRWAALHLRKQKKDGKLPTAKRMEPSYPEVPSGRIEVRKDYNP